MTPEDRGDWREIIHDELNLAVHDLIYALHAETDRIIAAMRQADKDKDVSEDRKTP